MSVLTVVVVELVGVLAGPTHPLVPFLDLTDAPVRRFWAFCEFRSSRFDLGFGSGVPLSCLDITSFRTAPDGSRSKQRRSGDSSVRVEIALFLRALHIAMVGRLLSSHMSVVAVRNGTQKRGFVYIYLPATSSRPQPRRF